MNSTKTLETGPQIRKLTKKEILLLHIFRDKDYSKKIVLANLQPSQSVSDEYIEDRRKEIIAELKRNKNIFVETPKSTEPMSDATIEVSQSPIASYINQLKGFKNTIEDVGRLADEVDSKVESNEPLNDILEFVQNKYNELSINTSFLLIQTLLKNKSTLAPYFNWIDIANSNIDSELFRINGVISHDFNHILSDLTDNISLFETYLNLNVPVSIEANVKPPTDDEIKIGISHIRKIFESYNRLLNFLNQFRKLAEDSVYTADEVITTDDLLSTLDSKGIPIDILPKGTFHRFNSFEEFISLRTLLFNAIQRIDDKENPVTKIHLIVSNDSENGMVKYKVFDDSTGGVWPEIYKNGVLQAYTQGYNEYDLPGIRAQNGGAIVGYLAGQRVRRLQENPTARPEKEIIDPKNCLVRFYNFDEISQFKNEFEELYGDEYREAILGCKCIELAFPNN